ncbi:MAG: cellulose biosynthesis cyclic di-GMP-binding regulatory protein BcsB [Bacteroidales bacterium]
MAKISWLAAPVAGLMAALAILSPLSRPAVAAPIAEQQAGTALDDPTVQPRGEVPLSYFHTANAPVRLRDEAGQQDFFISMARTAVVKDAILSLRYTNSVSLRPGRSVLSVRLNETTLAQIKLDPAQPIGEARVRLPAEVWRAGYNKLTLAVTQHYTDACEDSEAPELWTEIDLARSRLSFELAPLNRPYLLSDLGALFSPGLGGQRQVTLLTAPKPAADRLRAEALPYVAEALALRRQFAPLTVEHANWQEGPAGYLPASASGAMHVMVGTPEQMAAVLRPQDLPVVDGPKVVLTNLGQGRSRLLISGRNDDEVIAAARTLTVMDDALTPDTQATFPGERKTPTPMPLEGRVFMQGEKAYRFSALGFQTATLQGAGTRQINVTLPLPADFYTYENAKVRLSLDFAYGAGMGPGSVVNFSVNGRRIHGMLLDNKDGESFRNYLFEFPVRLLAPGANTLQLEVSSRPQLVGGECSGIKGRHLLFQLFDTSSVTTPEAGHAAVLPDLARFAAAGFPYVSSTGKAAGTVYVGSPELMGGALTLIGKLSQTARGTVDGWRIETGLPKTVSGQAIVLASTAQLNSDSFGEWALSLARVKKWPYRALQDLRTVSEQPQLTLDSVESLLSKETRQPTPLATGETVSQRSSLGQRAVLTASRNPAGGPADTLTVIAADSADILRTRIAELVDPALWGQIRGDLIAWQGKDDPMFTIQVADHYEVGDGNKLLLLRLIVSTNPWYWLAGTAAASALATTLAWWLIRRRKQRFGGRQQ